MNRPSPRRRRLAPLAGLVLGPAALLACADLPPRNPDPAQVQWTTYTNEAVGYAVDLPEVFHLSARRGDSVLFRYEGYPVLCINVVDQQEGRERGLWVGKEPVGPAKLGGRNGSRYIYDHYDGPAYVRTVSYVVPYRGKYLGLEFRTDLAEPDSLQRRVLDSFRFL